MDAFNVLIGAWDTEATHPMLPGTVVPGRATFEWLEGERFLIQRSHNDHPQFPDAIMIIGDIDGEITCHYFDSRGVFRVYRMSLSGDTLKIWRDDPEFAQRYTGTLTGDAITGTWQVSRDQGASWEDDLEQSFRRAT
jgi:hypothetical protein